MAKATFFQYMHPWDKATRYWVLVYPDGRNILSDDPETVMWLALRGPSHNSGAEMSSFVRVNGGPQ